MNFKVLYNSGLRSRRFLSRVGFLTRLAVGVGFFVQLRKSNWIIFYITLLSWEFLLKWYNSLRNFCWNRFLAVHHDFYWLLIATKLLTV